MLGILCFTLYLYCVSVSGVKAWFWKVMLVENHEKNQNWNFGQIQFFQNYLFLEAFGGPITIFGFIGA